MIVETLEGAHDGRRRAIALHARGAEDELGERVSAAQDVRDVAPHHADRRGDDADPPRPARDRPLAPLVEQPLGGELGAQRLVPRVEVAGAGGRDRLDVELIDALRLVHADAAVDDDLHPVGGSHGGPGQLVAEERRADLAARILEREEAVSRCRERRLADLALDPDVGEDRIGVEQAADAPVEVGDAQDARGGSNRSGPPAPAAPGPRASAGRTSVYS